MRSRGSWRVLLMLNSNFSIAPTYFTRNSAHASEELLPTVMQWISRKEKEATCVDNEGEGRLTGTLGGVGVKTGDCAGPGQTSQTGVHRLQTFKNKGCLCPNQTEKWSKTCVLLCFWCWSHCSGNCCCCGAFSLSGTWFTMTNHRSHPLPRPQRPEVCYFLHPNRDQLNETRQHLHEFIFIKLIIF